MIAGGIPGRLLTFGKWLLTQSPTSAALDITHRCNLRCLHCYWWREEQPAELEDHEMRALMHRIRGAGLRVAILYGGEPALRPELCRAADTIFDSILIFTNGTRPLFELKRGQWIVSLEGPRDVNDRIRGAGVWEQALAHIRKAPDPPIVHMTISRHNQHLIEAFVREMLSLRIKGIGFSFYTPDRGSDEPDFFIPLRERDRLAEDLVALRRRYGERVGFTPAMARQMASRGGFREWNHRLRCPVSRRVRCFRSDGSVKTCTYGDNADCSRCGCAAVAAYRGAFRPLDLQTLKVIFGLMMPEFGRPSRRSKGRAS
jgi:MoaA/NifB/PqqE/SkfB family radical SAM enzyme